MFNILQEYLVRLGFEDVKGFDKVKATLSAAEGVVGLSVFGMAKKMVEAQVAIGGALFGVSAAIVGMIDKVAMADQGYRLLGLRMMMTTESARQMDMVTKALGVSLEEMIWDPESRERAGKMVEIMRRMKEALGPDFEKHMKGWRDMRAEIATIGLELKFLGMDFVSRLFGKLDTGGIMAWLQTQVKWLEQHIPELADKFSTYVIPILKETWEMAKEGAHVSGELATVFTNFIGLLSGDESLEGTTFSMEKLAKAVGIVGHAMHFLLHQVFLLEDAMARYLNIMSLVMAGKWREAAGVAAEGIKMRLKEVGPTKSGIAERAAEAYSAFAQGRESETSSQEFTEYSHLLFPQVPSGIDPDFIAKGAAVLRQMMGEQTASATSLTHDKIGALITSTAQAKGVDPTLALAVAQQESPGLRQDRVSPAGAIGIMQLMPDTARTLGVNPYDAASNITGGVSYLAEMLKRYNGDTARALAGYNAGPGRADTARSIWDLRPETQDYVPKVFEHMRTRDWAAPVIHQTTHVGNVYVTNPNSEIDIHRAVHQAVRDAQDEQVQLDLAQLSPAY